MTDLVFANRVHTATMHRDDAPIGRTAQSHLRRRFGELRCCRRSWSDDGKGLHLHGHQLTFEVEFACAETDAGTGEVLGSRLLQDIHAAVRRQFEGTTLIAANDPQRELFELLAERGVVDIRIVDSAAMEASAAWVFDAAERIVTQATGGRVWVSRIAAHESGSKVITMTALPAKD